MHNWISPKGFEKGFLKTTMEISSQGFEKDYNGNFFLRFFLKYK